MSLHVVMCLFSSGFLRDVTGQWNDSFFAAGSLALVSATIYLAEPWAYRYGHKRTGDA